MIGRINNINTRVQNLEWSMKQLYWKVGFLDLWDLINADFLTGYSWRLNECKNYLYNCANNLLFTLKHIGISPNG